MTSSNYEPQWHINILQTDGPLETLESNKEQKEQ